MRQFYSDKTAERLIVNKQTLRVGLLILASLTVLSSFWTASVDWVTQIHLQLGTITVIQYTLLAICMFAYWHFGPKSNNWRDYKALLAVAVLIRLALIPIDAYTSNDVERYLFDGKVALSGFDPYTTPHDSPELTTLRATWPTPVEHAKYPTLYPPGAIGLFALSALTGPEYAKLTWKLLSTLASLLLLTVMTLLLSNMHKLKHLSLVALSPLLILETGIGVHLDIFSALAVACALFYWQKGKLKSAGVAIGLGALLKLLPVLLLIPLCFSQTNIKRFFTLGLSAILVLLVGYAIVFGLSMQPVGSTPVFFEKWRNASPLFEMFNYFVQGRNLLYLIITTVLLSLSLIVFFAWRTAQKNSNGKNSDSLLMYMQWTLITPLLLSPVVFPWYLLPLVPLFALRPNVFLASWMILLPVTYEVLNQFACCNNWAPQQWPVTLLALGLSTGLLIDRVLFYNKIKGRQTYV